MRVPLMDNLREFLLSFDYTNDREVRFIPKDKPLGSTTAYLTIPEIATLSATVNDAGAILMTYYYRKATTPKFDFFNDTKILFPFLLIFKSFFNQWH